MPISWCSSSLKSLLILILCQTILILRLPRWASMFFSTEALVRVLMANAQQGTEHDFGKHIIPRMIQNCDQVYAFPFRDRNSGSVKYWRDIGALDSYFDANMDLIAASSLFNLYDQDWPIRPYQPQAPPAKMVFHSPEYQGEILDSSVSNGGIISGVRVEHSIMRTRVFVHSWAQVKDCVMFDDVEIGRHARICRAIIDKGVKIPAGTVIDYDLDRDRQRFTVTDNGIVVIPKHTVVEPS